MARNLLPRIVPLSRRPLSGTCRPRPAATEFFVHCPPAARERSARKPLLPKLGTEGLLETTTFPFCEVPPQLFAKGPPSRSSALQRGSSNPSIERYSFRRASGIPARLFGASLSCLSV